MMRLAGLLLSFAVLGGLNQPLLADSATIDFTYSFNFTSTTAVIPESGPLLNASGWLTIDGGPLPVTSSGGYSAITSTNPPGYEVTAGGVYFNGTTFNLQTGPAGDYFRTEPYGAWADDILYPTAGSEYLLDDAGLAFRATDGSDDLLLIFGWQDPSQGYYIVQSPPDPFQSNIYEAYGQFTLAPEPSSIALLGTGMLAGCSSLIRRLRARAA